MFWLLCAEVRFYTFLAVCKDLQPHLFHRCLLSVVVIFAVYASIVPGFLFAICLSEFTGRELNPPFNSFSILVGELFWFVALACFGTFQCLDVSIAND